MLGYAGTGNDITGAPRAYTASGVATISAGADAARFFGARRGDNRVPDLYGVVQHGMVDAGAKGKIAEHGGTDPQGRNASPGAGDARTRARIKRVELLRLLS